MCPVSPELQGAVIGGLIGLISSGVILYLQILSEKKQHDSNLRKVAEIFLQMAHDHRDQEHHLFKNYPEFFFRQKDSFLKASKYSDALEIMKLELAAAHNTNINNEAYIETKDKIVEICKKIVGNKK